MAIVTAVLRSDVTPKEESMNISTLFGLSLACIPLLGSLHYEHEAWARWIAGFVLLAFILCLVGMALMLIRMNPKTPSDFRTRNDRAVN